MLIKLKQNSYLTHGMAWIIMARELFALIFDNGDFWPTEKFNEHGFFHECLASWLE